MGGDPLYGFAEIDGRSFLVRERSAEERILSSVIPELFCSDVVDFAELAARRVYDGHALFRRDHACGAFRYWDSD